MGPLSRYAAKAVNRPALLRGFTLLELLVVIVILGVTAGLVTLSAAPSEDRLLAVEIDRLSALFRLAQSEAMARGRPLTWKADRQGYRFVGDGDSRGDKPDDPLRARDWPFAVERVEAPALLFGLEPLLPPSKVLIVTPRREIVLLVDSFGNVSRAK